jgi:copper chaperone
MSIELNVTGMSCGHCKVAVEGALKKVEGVKVAEVDLSGGKARVEGEKINPEALIAAVLDEGYGASVSHA